MQDKVYTGIIWAMILAGFILVMFMLLSCGSTDSETQLPPDLAKLRYLPIDVISPKYKIHMSFSPPRPAVFVKAEAKLIDDDVDEFLRCEAANYNRTPDMTDVLRCHYVIVPSQFNCDGSCQGLTVFFKPCLIVLEDSLQADADEWFDFVYNDPETPHDLSSDDICTKGI